MISYYIVYSEGLFVKVCSYVSFCLTTGSEDVIMCWMHKDLTIRGAIDWLIIPNFSCC